MLCHRPRENHAGNRIGSGGHPPPLPHAFSAHAGPRVGHTGSPATNSAWACSINAIRKPLSLIADELGLRPSTPVRSCSSQPAGPALQEALGHYYNLAFSEWLKVCDEKLTAALAGSPD
jgi:hypothetical protein